MTELFKKYGNQTSQNNVAQNPQVGMIKQAFGFLKNAKNPQALFSQMAQNNPQYQSAMSYIQQNGGDAQQAFYNFASQCGMNQDDANNIINMLK